MDCLWWMYFCSNFILNSKLSVLSRYSVLHNLLLARRDGKDDERGNGTINSSEKWSSSKGRFKASSSNYPGSRHRHCLRFTAALPTLQHECSKGVKRIQCQIISFCWPATNTGRAESPAIVMMLNVCFILRQKSNCPGPCGTLPRLKLFPYSFSALLFLSTGRKALAWTADLLNMVRFGEESCPFFLVLGCNNKRRDCLKTESC